MTKAKMALVEARAIAEEVMAKITDVCESVVIAGSIRREKGEVGDIELVIVPKYQPKPGAMFDVIEENALEAYLRKMANAGTLTPSLKTNGTKKAWFGKPDEESRYIAADYQGKMGVDFFIILPDRMDLYGWQLLIRTGPGDANQLLVTRKDQRGIKPHHIFVGEGRVVDLRTDTPIMLPDEETVFEVWGMDYVAPIRRSVDAYWEALKR